MEGRDGGRLSWAGTNWRRRRRLEEEGEGVALDDARGEAGLVERGIGAL